MNNTIIFSASSLAVNSLICEFVCDHIILILNRRYLCVRGGGGLRQWNTKLHLIIIELTNDDFIIALWQLLLPNMYINSKEWARFTSHHGWFLKDFMIISSWGDYPSARHLWGAAENTGWNKWMKLFGSCRWLY